MRTFVKTCLIVFVIIFFISLVFPTIPPHSWYLRFILSNNSILSKLNLNKNNCHFEEGTMFGDTPTSAYMFCLTANRYKSNSDAEKAAIGDMRNILEKNGWTFSSTESWKWWNIVYKKGFRKIHIYPFDWEQGYNDEMKLIVSLQ